MVEGFYVYGIKRDGVLVYVGKGRGNRVNESLKIHNGDEYVIFSDDLGEKEAFKKEQTLIQSFVRCGIELENKIRY